MCELKDFDRLELDNDHRVTLEGELELWHRAYLPVGKTVLDLGAGCGETAQFYLNHGAEKVISIESDSNCYNMLRSNFANDHRVIPILAHIDSIKCDIEGGERDLVIETHFPFKFIKIKELIPNVVLWRIKEDWGNIVTKAARKAKHWWRTSK
jgi:predicted nicotinamide N-methyase